MTWNLIRFYSLEIKRQLSWTSEAKVQLAFLFIERKDSAQHICEWWKLKFCLSVVFLTPLCSKNRNWIFLLDLVWRKLCPCCIDRHHLLYIYDFPQIIVSRLLHLKSGCGHYRLYAERQQYSFWKAAVFSFQLQHWRPVFSWQWAHGQILHTTFILLHVHLLLYRVRAAWWSSGDC